MKTSCTNSLLVVMTVAMLVLKLAHVIDWAWWIVLLPAAIELASRLLRAIVETAREYTKETGRK